MSWIAAKSRCLAPQKGPQFTQKPLPGNPVPGDRAGLDQRRPLPILADALIIGHRRRHRHRRRRRGRVGAKPQISPKHVAVAGALFEQPHKIAREPAEEGLGALARCHPRPSRVVKQNQVDIARIVEFGAAKLAHAEHDQPAVVLRIGRVGQRDQVSCSCLTQQMAQPAPTAASAKQLSAPVCCSSDQVPASSATAASSAVRRLAMRRRRINAAVSSSEIVERFGLGRDFLERRIGAFFDEAGQEPPFLDREPAQKRAVAKDRGEQPLCPAASLLQLWAERAAGSSGAAASAASQASRPSASHGIRRLGQLVAIGRKVRQQLHADTRTWQQAKSFRALPGFPAQAG